MKAIDNWVQTWITYDAYFSANVWRLVYLNSLSREVNNNRNVQQNRRFYFFLLLNNPPLGVASSKEAVSSISSTGLSCRRSVGSTVILGLLMCLHSSNSSDCRSSSSALFVYSRELPTYSCLLGGRYPGDWWNVERKTSSVFFKCPFSLVPEHNTLMIGRTKTGNFATEHMPFISGLIVSLPYHWQNTTTQWPNYLHEKRANWQYLPSLLLPSECIQG